MTEAEAIKDIEGIKRVNGSKSLDMAIKALKKQIEKKPFVDTGKFLKCSHCHSVVRNSDKYCHECGQKLDSEV